MGWRFGYYTRKELVDHLCEGNGVTTLKRRFVGNTLYTVNAYEQANGTVIKYACVYLLKGRSNTRYGWGYKDMDETMHPYYYDFPVSWLDLLSPTDSENARKWREEVRKRAEKLARLKVGTTWERPGGERYTILERRSPSSLRVKDQWGDTWRMHPRTLLGAEEVTS